MSQQRPNARLSILAVVAALVLAAGGVAFWKSRSVGGGALSPAQEAARERERVAAFDPAFDPAKPAGGIAGVVRDPDGNPVDGAVVAVTRNPGKTELPSFRRPSARTTLTSGGGRFRLDDVLPGDYGVTATALAWAPARNGKVKVDSEKTAEVALVLARGGVLFTGEVQDVGGGPVAGARALLRATGFMLRPGDASTLFEVAADDKGVFKVRVAPGDYDVTVRAEGYSPARDRLSLAGPQTRRYKLNPAARLSGRVLDRQTSEPVAGASVWLRLDRLEGYVDRDATSDGQGRFSFDDLGAGGYVVLARAEHRIGIARTVTVGIAQAVDGVDVFIERGRAIRGLVVDGEGKPVEGIRVAAGRADPPFERPVFVKSDARGAFALEGLLPAKYRVNAWAEGGRGTPKPEMAQVTSKDVEGVRLVLTAGLVVRGKVVDGQGKPVAEAAVLGVVDRRAGDQRFSMDRVATDADGTFALERLSPGRLTVTARAGEQGNAKWGPEEVTTSPPPLTLKIESAASVAGTVKYEDGTPASRVMVVAMPAQMGGPMFGPPQQATTDDAGRFLVAGLDAGRFGMMARRDTTFMGGTPRSRQEVTLAAGEQKTGIELVLPNAGKRIAGKVVGSDGRPVSGAVVSAGMEREGFSFRLPQREGVPTSPHAVSDPEGAFAIEDLEDGKYTLWASDPGHADGELKGVAAGGAPVVLKLEGGASLAGVVKGKDGTPVADYSIAALPGGPPGQSPDDRARMQMMARMWSPSAQVHDPAGTFFVGRLAPGAYELTVTTADGQGGLLPVTVGSGEKKQGLVIVIDAGAKLVGRVVDLDTSAPLEGVSVQVASPTSRLTATTGRDGSFTLAGLSPGRARVDFRLGDGESYVPEHVEVDVKPGQGTIDLGTIRELKGNMRERRGDMSTYGRVGVTVSLVDGKASVTGVRPGFPADKAGLRQGELVLTINGRATDGLGNGALDYLAGGKLGEPLHLKIQPREGGAPREVKLDRVPFDYDPSRPAVAGNPRK
jgi:hypothetical protein